MVSLTGSNWINGHKIEEMIGMFVEIGVHEIHRD